MITKVAVKNFQSLKDIELGLTPFTVIVGQSSSGKSALTRAIRTATGNRTGKDFITHGELTSQIQLTTDKGTLTLTKGKPEDSYVILDNADIKNPRRYTKLGGAVPEDVTAFIGIAAKDALNYANQFDMPYLLTTSAAEVARTLGELTNVASIFEASREALRLKNEYARDSKTRTADLSVAEAKMENYADLEQRLDEQANLEARYDFLTSATERLSRLNDLIMTVQTAQSRLKAAQALTAAPVPHTDTLRALIGRQQRLNAILLDVQNSGRAQQAAQERLTTSAVELDSLNREYDDLLVSAGTCPMCGQNTKEISHAH